MLSAVVCGGEDDDLANGASLDRWTHCLWHWKGKQLVCDHAFVPARSQPLSFESTLTTLRPAASGLVRSAVARIVPETRITSALYTASILICFIPTGLYALMRPKNLHLWGYLGSILWSIGCVLMVLAADYIWEQVRRIAEELDEIFDNAQAERRILLAQTARNLRYRGPLLLGAAVSVSSTVIARYWFKYQDGSGTLPDTAMTALVGFLVGHSAYLIAITAYFAYTLRNCKNLTLDQLSPLLTPGLNMLSAVARKMAQLGLLMWAIMGGALATEYFSGPVNMPLWAVVLAVFFGLFWIIVAGVLAQLWIAAPAVRARAALLHRLDRQAVSIANGDISMAFGPYAVRTMGLRKMRIVNLGHTELAVIRPEKDSVAQSLTGYGSLSDRQSTRLSEVASLFQVVQESPSSYTDISLVSLYTASVAGAVVPVILGVLRRS